MKYVPLVLVLLLPSVMLASVSVSSTSADADGFISVAEEAMSDGDYVAAFALFECALRRDPHSSEARIGSLMARALMEEHSAELVAVTAG